MNVTKEDSPASVYLVKAEKSECCRFQVHLNIVSTPCKDPASYVQKLKSAMETLRAVPTWPSSRPHPYVIEALSSASHVFVRHDAVKTPLQQPYDGPYKVFKRESKYFTLDIKGRLDIVSIDRLKPAHLDCQTDIVSPPPTPPPLLHRAPKSPLQCCPAPPTSTTTQSSQVRYSAASHNQVRTSCSLAEAPYQLCSITLALEGE